MSLNNSAVSLDDVAKGGGLGQPAPLNTNPPSATSLGSGVSTKQPVADVPASIGVGGGPLWEGVTGYIPNK
jgi:hypothetical protein